MLELVLGGELVACGVQPAGDLLVGVGAAPAEPSPQRPLVGRCDEHRDRIRDRLAHLAGPLHLDLEHDRRAAAQSSFELRA